MKHLKLILSSFLFLACIAHAEQKPYSVRMLDSEIRRSPSALYLDGRQGERKWNYTTGLELKSFLDVAHRYELDYAVEYVKAWADTMATDKGEVYSYKKSNYNVDHVCPARIYFNLYDLTGDKKYRKVLRNIREQLDTQPRTESGEFWHKKIYPHQVWLDGLYMALPFYAEYTKRFEKKAQKDSLYKDIIHQFVEASKNTFDPATGLFRHAWDESKSMFWADPETGLSAHAWGRAVGWYAVALVEVLDFIPEKVEGRNQLTEQLNYLLEVLPKYAEPESGMWYQVLDCPGREGNYLESTASAMFTYAFLKGLRKRYIDASHRDYIVGLYEKFVKQFVKENEDGSISLTSCCAVAGLGGKQMRKGDYAYYLSEPVIENDCKGVGPFIWASLEYEALKNIDYQWEGSPEKELAFEGAEGGGKYTAGGRGGKEYVVTTLEDSGEDGSLRYAVEAEGPRVVKFAVSGDIHLKKPLEVHNSHISILGQTAPGKGITLKDHGMYIETDEVIVRYMKFRMGSDAGVEDDALGARHCNNVIIDHCSVSWATDENCSVYGNSNTTVSWCIISEALNSSVHSKGNHGYGGIWGGRNVTFHHNLFASNSSRNPRFDHPSVYIYDDLLYRRGTVEFVNNVVFNWGMKAIYGGEDGWFNVEGNFFKAGPASRKLDGEYIEFYTAKNTSLIPGRYYIKDNIFDVSAVKNGNYEGTKPDYEKIEENARRYEQSSPAQKFKARHPYVGESPEKAFKAVLKGAGDSIHRDAIDKRIVKEVKTGKTTYKGSVTGLPGIIDKVSDLK